MSTHTTTPYKALRRPLDDRVVAGVCSGIGRYFSIDPVIVRVGFAALTVFTWGCAAIAYPIIWFLIPEEAAPAGPAPFPGQPVAPFPGQPAAPTPAPSAASTPAQPTAPFPAPPTPAAQPPAPATTPAPATSNPTPAAALTDPAPTAPKAEPKADPNFETETETEPKVGPRSGEEPRP